MGHIEGAERVAVACRVLGKLGATHTTFGHVSARCGDDGGAMVIRGKGSDETGVRYTSPEDVVRVGLDVTLLSGRAGLRPPSESYLHAWVYRLRPDAQSVIHLHPETAVLLTIAGRELRPVYGAYGRGSALAATGVPTYDSSLTISDDERGERFARFIGEKNAVLMRGHGITVVGDSVEEAAVTAMSLIELADITYKALLIGQPAVLPADEVAEISRMQQAGRPLGSAGGQAGALSMWRYYQRLAGE